MPRLTVLILFLAALAVTASAQTTAYNIDQKTGWQACTNCAGVPGATDAKTSFYQFQWSPSMDSKSAKFSISPTGSYQNALWHVNVGATTAKHFVYDTYFYITNPSVSMALEFDLNEYVGGKAYVFGVQCNVQSSHTWDVWDPYYKHWHSTGVSCPVFPAYRWNHVVEEFERTWDNKLHFVAITYNGVKHYVNQYYSPSSTSWYGLGIDFQMDGNRYGNAYSTWLDKITVQYW